MQFLNTSRQPFFSPDLTCTYIHTHAYCRYGDDLPEELRDFSTTVLVATFAGFFFGGMIGARHAGDKFIALNHSSKFTSVMQAQVSAYPLQK